MHRSFLPAVLAALLLAAGCRKNQPAPVPYQQGTTITLLRVDYQTHQFEGGRQFHLSQNVPTDSVPVSVHYKSPGDFGNITLKYVPTGDTLFDGGIVWMGKGDLRYPTFDPAATFGTSGIQVPAPDSATLQGLYPNQYAQRFTNSAIQQAWSGIASLSLTRDNSTNGGRKALFLYTPSVGVGNPADWDYFWVLYQTTAY